MKPEQIQWLQDRKLEAKDVNQDDTGYHILITNCMTGESVKQYIPSDAPIETLQDEIVKEITTKEISDATAIQ